MSLHNLYPELANSHWSLISVLFVKKTDYNPCFIYKSSIRPSNCRLRPPEGFHIHWKGLKNSSLQFETLNKVISIQRGLFIIPQEELRNLSRWFTIPLEGFRYSSRGCIIPLERFRYPSREFIIPLEGFKYPSRGFIILLKDSDIHQGGL